MQSPDTRLHFSSFSASSNAIFPSANVLWCQYDQAAYFGVVANKHFAEDGQVADSRRET